MRDYVESETYRHIAVQNLALYAQRLGKLFVSASTWYKMIRERGWKRPRRRVHPAKPKTGLRATRSNEYWQIDATVIRLTTGIRIYLQAVIDNFSRRILAWRVSDMLSSATTRELLIEASMGLPDESANANVVVVTDGGSENFGEVDQLLKDSSSLRRVLAQVDIISSNSLIEAFWRQLKHGWLFLNTLNSTVAVRRLVAFYVREHNEKIPRAVLGARPSDLHPRSRERIHLDFRYLGQRSSSSSSTAPVMYASMVFQSIATPSGELEYVSDRDGGFQAAFWEGANC